MAGTGPTPNPNSRRQMGNQANTWTDLPAAGFTGAIPEWPLGPSILVETLGTSVRELDLWDEIWRTPQAEAWHRNGWARDVALYVRFFTIGETGRLDEAKEARMWSDRLGLNPAAMLKNRWRVTSDEVAEKRTEKTTAEKTKARRRLKVADSGVAGS
jgi:hypothetical protein